MIQIFKQNGNTPYGLNEYVIDTKDELSKISTNITMGSSVFVIEENKTYVLNGNKEWVEKINTVAGGIAQETDPTVPNWAKQPLPPTVDMHFNPASYNAQSGQAVNEAKNIVGKQVDDLIPQFTINDDLNYIEIFTEINNSHSKFKVFYLCVIVDVKDSNNDIILPKGTYFGYKGEPSVRGSYRLKQCNGSTSTEYEVHWYGNEDAPRITLISFGDTDLNYVPTSSKPQSGLAVKEAIDAIELNNTLSYTISDEFTMSDMLDNVSNDEHMSCKFFTVTLKTDLVDQYDDTKILSAGYYFVFKTETINWFIFKKCNSDVINVEAPPSREIMVCILADGGIDIQNVTAETIYNKNSIYPQSGQAVRQAINSAIPHYSGITSIEDFLEINHSWYEDDQYGDERKVFSMWLDNDLIDMNGNIIYQDFYFCFKWSENYHYILISQSNHYSLEIFTENGEKVFRAYNALETDHYYKNEKNYHLQTGYSLQEAINSIFSNNVIAEVTSFSDLFRKIINVNGNSRLTPKIAKIQLDINLSDNFLNVLPAGNYYFINNMIHAGNPNTILISETTGLIYIIERNRVDDNTTEYKIINPYDEKINKNLSDYNEFTDTENIKSCWLYVNELTENLCERISVEDIKNYTNNIIDEGNYFESNSLEEILQEIGASLKAIKEQLNNL